MKLKTQDSKELMKWDENMKNKRWENWLYTTKGREKASSVGLQPLPDTWIINEIKMKRMKQFLSDLGGHRIWASY